MFALRPKAAVLAGAAAIALSLFSPGKSAYACSSQPYIGGLCLFGGTFTIRGWAIANGALLPISQYQALFSILGTTYGGDGRTTFALPDLRGRVAIGYGQGPGLTNYRQGARGGSENLSSTPSHTHVATAHAQSATGTTTSPAGAVWANEGRGAYSTTAPDVDMLAGAVTVAATGAQTVQNLQPYLVLNWLVAVTGIFPSRP